MQHFYFPFLLDRTRVGLSPELLTKRSSKVKAGSDILNLLITSFLLIQIGTSKKKKDGLCHLRLTFRAQPAHGDDY